LAATAAQVAVFPPALHWDAIAGMPAFHELGARG
jgi:hypothetical protein